jgi:hypothetical protein
MLSIYKGDVLPKTDIHAPRGIRTTISAGEGTQNKALDRAATGTGIMAPYSLV